MTKTIGKTAIWTILYFWVSPPELGIYVPNAATSCSMTHLLESSLQHSWFGFIWKISEKKDFASLTQVIKLLVWVPKIIKTYAELMQWVNVVLQFGLTWTTVKSALKVLLIFQTISDENYGKNCYLDNFVFLSHSPS